MDREQIIKALECCIEVRCDVCPRRENCGNRFVCSSNLKKDALALIKELTEENNRLVVSEVGEIAVAREIVYRVRNEHPVVVAIKADAVKEIQTMLAMHFGTYTDTDTVKVVDVFKLLTQIEKEMSEEGGG